MQKTGEWSEDEEKIAYRIFMGKGTTRRQDKCRILAICQELERDKGDIKWHLKKIQNSNRWNQLSYIVDGQPVPVRFQ